MTIAWSLLIYVGYNVLTVEAAEKDDKKVCESYGGEWAKYDDGDRYCKIDNEKDQELYSVRPGDSLSGTFGDAEHGRIDLDLTDEEAAKIEDAVCDDEDADSTDVKGCMSDKREKQLNNIVKACDKSDGKINSKGECETDSDGPKADKFHDELMKLEEETGYPSQKEEVIEDWSNTVTDEEQKRINDEANYQQLKHEQLADSSTNPNKVVEQVLEEESNENEESNDSSSEEEEESDDAGDSSDSGDDSSSSDDGGDREDSSESEE
jgi:hypothetical protein